MRILVTGGAGFIGSHLVDKLLADGHTVTVFDNLDPQVHGNGQKIPDYLNPKAKFIKGDVRNIAELDTAMQNQEMVYFLAAAVGVGQSMYEIQRYVEINSLGGANFLQLLSAKKHPIKKVVVASSMSIYGEGCYKSASGEKVYPTLRQLQQLKEGNWEFPDSKGGTLAAISTDENKPLLPTSIYAITKRDHEEMFLSVCPAYDVPCVALRFFNVFGTRQALSNPYTGVAAIFSSQILQGRSCQIFEDGLQTRDFVHVSDIVQALTLSLEKSAADNQVLNVGTGRAVSIKHVADTLCQVLDFGKAPEITNRFRVGDIRHCYADITKISSLLGYKPKVSFESGMEELCAWVREQNAPKTTPDSFGELAQRNLVV